MLGVLVKKEFMQLFKGYFVNQKTGKVRSKTSIALFFLMFAGILVMIGFAMYGMASALADAFVPAGLSWLYFAILGILATLLGTFGSVFNTYAALYKAKDNDLLLSMPLSPFTILLSRIVNVYGLGVLYSAVIFIPAILCYWIRCTGYVTALTVVFPIIQLFLLGFFITAFTCALGWVIAIISSKLKNKNIITFFVSLAFMAGYYFVTAKINVFLTKIVTMGEVIASKIKIYVYPFYLFGKGTAGDVLSFIIFAVISLGLFAIALYVLGKTFISLTTAGEKTSKKKYSVNQVKVRSLDSALLRKELKRFTGSPNYMLNCGFGIIFLFAIGVAALIKGNLVIENIAKAMPQFKPIIPVIAMGCIFAISTMNDISSPSISLEGKSLWIVQSLPVKAYDVLKAKIKLHILIVIMPAIFLTVCLGITIKARFALFLMMIINSIMCVIFDAQSGLIANLTWPNLTWTNEIVPIKQGIPVVIALFGGWILSVAVIGIYYLLAKFISAVIYLLIVALVFFVLNILMNRYLKTKGSEIFANL